MTAWLAAWCRGVDRLRRCGRRAESSQSLTEGSSQQSICKGVPHKNRCDPNSLPPRKQQPKRSKEAHDTHVHAAAMLLRDFRPLHMLGQPALDTANSKLLGGRGFELDYADACWGALGYARVGID